MTNEEETHVMQLAAISTASIQNTEKTVKGRIDRSNPYWTQAYEDVCRAVDREMRERQRAVDAEMELLALKGPPISEEIRAKMDANRAEAETRITTIQQKQIERLMEARDAEKLRADKAEARLSKLDAYGEESEGVQGFILDVLEQLEKLGVDTTNWDGDESSAYIMAHCVAGKIREQRERADRAEAACKQAVEALRAAAHQRLYWQEKVNATLAALEAVSKEAQP